MKIDFLFFLIACAITRVVLLRTDRNYTLNIRAAFCSPIGHMLSMFFRKMCTNSVLTFRCVLAVSFATHIKCQRQQPRILSKRLNACHGELIFDCSSSANAKATTAPSSSLPAAQQSRSQTQASPETAATTQAQEDAVKPTAPTPATLTTTPTLQPTAAVPTAALPTPAAQTTASPLPQPLPPAPEDKKRSNGRRFVAQGTQRRGPHGITLAQKILFTKQNPTFVVQSGDVVRVAGQSVPVAAVGYKYRGAYKECRIGLALLDQKAEPFVRWEQPSAVECVLGRANADDQKIIDGAWKVAMAEEARCLLCSSDASVCAAGRTCRSRPSRSRWLRKRDYRALSVHLSVVC